MARINGTAIILSASGSPVAQVENATLNVNFDPVSANDKDSGEWESHLAIGGYKNWDLDFSGNADFLVAGNFKVLFDLLNARAAVAVIFGPASGGVTATGNAFFTGVTITANDEEAAGISGTAQGTGELSVGT